MYAIRSYYVKRVISENEFECADNWNLTRDILKGFSFRLLGSDFEETQIEYFDYQNKIIRLSQSVLNIESRITSYNVCYTKLLR